MIAKIENAKEIIRNKNKFPCSSNPLKTVEYQLNELDNAPFHTPLIDQTQSLLPILFQKFAFSLRVNIGKIVIVPRSNV